MVQMDMGDAKFIDPECIIYGPPGLDVGSLLPGYVLAAVHTNILLLQMRIYQLFGCIIVQPWKKPTC